MKNLLSNVLKAGISFAFTAGIVTSSFGQCLITTGPTNDCSYGDAIDNITLNAISASNAGCSGGGTGYSAFGTPIWNLQLGSNYPISLAVGGATYNQGVRIWIDVNNNGQYEATESVYSSTAPALNHTGILIVPAVGSVATVPMRVMCAYNTTPATTDACTSNLGSYGETEDYLVNLTSGCTDPAVPTVTYTPAAVCTGGTATLNIAGALNDATDWYVYSGSCGGTLVGSTATSSLAVTPAGPSTVYYVRGEGGCVTPGSCGSVEVFVGSPNTGTDVLSACDSYTWIDGNTYTASNNTAQFTLTNVAGCDSVVTLDLTINSSTSGTDVVSACDSYTWIDGNTYTASNNTAQFTLTNAAGCDSVVTLDLTISASPVVSLVSSQDEMLGNDGSIDISVAGGSTYTYDWSNAATTEDISGLGAGPYSVTVTDDNTGCTDTLTVMVGSQVGLEEIKNELFRIYPNPSSGEFNIQVNEFTDGMSYEVVDANGKVVVSGKIENSTTKVVMGNVSNGTYVVTVRFAQGTSKQTIVVNRN